MVGGGEAHGDFGFALPTWRFIADGTEAQRHPEGLEHAYPLRLNKLLGEEERPYSIFKGLI